MDIVRFKGGLGNQMFQYAFVEFLRDKGREVNCSLGFYSKNANVMPFILDKVFPNVVLSTVSEQDFIRIDAEWRKIRNDAEMLDKFKKNISERFFWVEEEDSRYYPEVLETRECAFVGYWQTEKYFKTLREKILQLYEFREGEQKLIDLGEKLQSDYASIHVRRGDYLQSLYNNICTKEYYSTAISVMKKRISNIKFIIFSDDINWVEENLKYDNTIFCRKEMFDDYQDWYDMYLMTKCKGNIIANSSFSWWGAWLNQSAEHVVIAPNKWLNEKNTPDIWCEKWIRI